MSDKLKIMYDEMYDGYYLDGDIKTAEEVTMEAVEEAMNNQYQRGRDDMKKEMDRGAVSVGLVIIAAAFTFGATLGILLF